MPSFLPSMGELWERFINTLFGSPADMIEDVMEFLLRTRMIPAYDVIEDPYNNMILMALIVATITTLIGLAIAASKGSPIKAIEAIAQIALVFVVAYLLPWLSLFLYELFHGLSGAFVDLVGVDDSEWWEPLLQFSPPNGIVLSIGALAAWGIVTTQTLGLMVNLFLMLIGPTLFALRLIPIFGSRANRLLWVGITWSASVVLTALVPLGIGLVVIRLISDTVIGAIPMFESSATVFVLLAGLLSPFIALYLARKVVVSIEGKLNESNAGRMITGRSVEGSAESSRSSTARKVAKGAVVGTAVVKAADNTSPNTGLRQVATHAGLSLAKTHPWLVAGTAALDMAARKSKQTSQPNSTNNTPSPDTSQQATQPQQKPEG